MLILKGLNAVFVPYKDPTAPLLDLIGGRVDIVSGGSGYTFPTVDFDLPDGSNGVQATGHALMDANGSITQVVVDSPGSGYSFAPGITIRDGTIYDPIWPGGSGVTTTSPTLFIDTIVLEAFGLGYNTPPIVTITDPTGLGATATAVLDNGITVKVGMVINIGDKVRVDTETLEYKERVS